MKRLFLLFLFLSFVVFSPSQARAQEEQALTLPTPTVTPVLQKTEYQLPYTGILPDNPFYFLKTTRDRIVGFLVADPLKKAAFNVLQADKRLAAGVALFDKKDKQQLAESTIAKGENYFEEAIVKVKEAKSQGQPIKDMSLKLLQSAKTHQEVLMKLEKKATGDIKTKLTATRMRVDTFIVEAQKLQPQ